MRAFSQILTATHLSDTSEWLNRLFAVILFLFAVGSIWVSKENFSRAYSERFGQAELKQKELIIERNRLAMEFAEVGQYSQIVLRAQKELGMVFLAELPDTVFLNPNRYRGVESTRTVKN